MKVQVLSGLPIYIFSMSIKELKSKTLYKEFSIEIPYSQLEDLLDNKVNELLPNVTLPGFRTGKAPVNIVKKKYETKLLSEVMEKLIQDNTKKLIEEKKLKLFRQPRVDIKKYEKEKPIELEVKVDLEPEVKLKKFEEINLTKYEISLSEKNINENYNNFINSQKKYGKLKNDRSVKIGDKIFVNLSSEDNSAPNFIKEQKNLPIKVFYSQCASKAPQKSVDNTNGRRLHGRQKLVTSTGGMQDLQVSLKKFNHPLSFQVECFRSCTF